MLQSTPNLEDCVARFVLRLLSKQDFFHDCMTFFFLSGLRMATSYSISVEEVDPSTEEPGSKREERAFDTSIKVDTKGCKN